MFMNLNWKGNEQYLHVLTARMPGFMLKFFSTLSYLSLKMAKASIINLFNKCLEKHMCCPSDSPSYKVAEQRPDLRIQAPDFHAAIGQSPSQVSFSWILSGFLGSPQPKFLFILTVNQRSGK